jgi:hypothetical protein
MSCHKIKNLKSCKITTNTLNVDNLNIKCDEELIPITDTLCDLNNSNKWLSLLPQFSRVLTSDNEPFIISLGSNNVLQPDPNSTLPKSMWTSVGTTGTTGGYFTAPESGIYALNLNNIWFGLVNTLNGNVRSDWTMEGEYTSRWVVVPTTNSCYNYPGNGIFCQLTSEGQSLSVSPLANNAPRTQLYQKNIYTNNTYIVKLEKGQQFYADAYASYTPVAPTTSTDPVGEHFLGVVTQIMIYLLTPVNTDLQPPLSNIIQASLPINYNIGPL